MRLWLPLVLLGGCILEQIDLSGKTCPCTAEFVCDPTTNTCVAELTTPDAGTPDTGPADSGEPDAGEDGGILPPSGCVRDSECGGGQICSGGACQPGCGSCPVGVCDVTGHCFTGNASCAAASDCNPPSEVCIEGSCVPGCAVGEGSCIENRMCDPSSGYCVAAPRCGAAAGGELCPDEQFFCTDGGYCVRKCSAPGAAQCKGTTACDGERCGSVQIGEFCAADNVCPAGLCFQDGNQSYCSTTCGASADCPIGFVCDEQGGASVCTQNEEAALASGAACMAAANTCQSEICTNDVCVEQCGRKSHCDAFGTNCVVVETTRGQMTEFTRECGPDRPGGAAPGVVCGANADCSSGLCDRFEDVCTVPCCADADCPAAESCLLYTLDQNELITACSPRAVGTTTVGMSCGLGDDCQTGVCAPSSPSNLTGPKVCTSRCCTDADCADLFLGSDGFCQSIPGPVAGTIVGTCFAR